MRSLYANGQEGVVFKRPLGPPEPLFINQNNELRQHPNIWHSWIRRHTQSYALLTEIVGSIPSS